MDERMASTWFEPFNYIEWGENYKVYRLDETCGQAITRLIKLVRQSSASTRDWAILRLYKLFQIHGLTEEQCGEFAEALYTYVDNETGLPKTSILYNSSFLGLPKKDKEQVQRDYYNWIIEQDVPSIFIKDGVYNGASEYKKFVRDWIHSSNSIFSDKVDPEDINYSEEDCIELLKKIFVWWESERINRFLDEDLFQGYPVTDIYSLTYLMIHVIFPKLEVIDNRTKGKIRSLFEEIEERGIIISHILPSTLHFLIYETNYIYQKLKKELDSNDEEKVKYSSQGCLFWIIYNNRKIAPEIPIILLNNWVNKVYSRRQPGLDHILQDIGTCLLYVPNALNEMQWDYILEGLEYLIEETDINVIMQESKFQLFSRAEYANYKQLCVRLAGVSYKSFEENGKDIPDTLIKWQDICTSDSLPEVRKHLYLFWNRTE